MVLGASRHRRVRLRRGSNRVGQAHLIVVVDNYDSYVYNLVQLIGRHRRDITVLRNDKATPEAVEKLGPTCLILSPGPRGPAQAGHSVALVGRLRASIPILGVCLGHQCIAAAYGADVQRADVPYHGKATEIVHSGDDLYAGVPRRFIAGRYHSLEIDPSTIPDTLEVTATTVDGLPMAIADRRRPIYGLQFHPESILTPFGRRILANFVEKCVTLPTA